MDTSTAGGRAAVAGAVIGGIILAFGLWIVWEEYLRDASRRLLRSLGPAFGVLGGLCIVAGVGAWIVGVEDLPVSFLVGGASLLVLAIMVVVLV